MCFQTLFSAIVATANCVGSVSYMLPAFSWSYWSFFSCLFCHAGHNMYLHHAGIEGKGEYTDMTCAVGSLHTIWLFSRRGHIQHEATCRHWSACDIHEYLLSLYVTYFSVLLQTHHHMSWCKNHKSEPYCSNAMIRWWFCLWLSFGRHNSHVSECTRPTLLAKHGCSLLSVLFCSVVFSVGNLVYFTLATQLSGKTQVKVPTTQEPADPYT